MTFAGHRPTALIATALFAVVLLAIALQLIWSSPFGTAGPLEFTNEALNLAIALGATWLAWLLWRRHGRLSPLWILIAAIGWMWPAAEIAGFDQTPYPPIDPDDVGTLVIWALTAAVILPGLASRGLQANSRLFLGMGFALQSTAFAADLGDGSIFHLPNLTAAAPITESFETLGLASYLAGLVLVALPLVSTRAAGGEALVWRIAQSTPVRALAIGWESLAYRLWRLSHPGASFADYYADGIGRKLDMGKPHRTLGRAFWSHESFFASQGDRGSKFESEGVKLFDKIKALGIQPGHVVVDYGCGSLRIGQHFIRYLEAGHYWGLDVTDRFFTDGLALIPGTTVADRRPNLGVIGEDTLARARTANPDYIFSMAVMKHVPKEEMGRYWSNLIGLMKTGSTAIVDCDIAARDMRTAAKNWAYTEAYVRCQIAARDPAMPVTVSYADKTRRMGGETFRRASFALGPRP
ncbi:MAG: hypothetical protein HY245_02235 [Rhizobiales bacterium]|nr:hypothetical protein [Hyphomicrobiales bacterium]MBI3672247.1 hypothetical protein [Hyphomicrobiales bacterium]